MEKNVKHFETILAIVSGLAVLSLALHLAI